ncbi:hypothetical protein Hypma_005134, partial [Hypsizygus marmoreus]
YAKIWEHLSNGITSLRFSDVPDVTFVLAEKLFLELNTSRMRPAHHIPDFDGFRSPSDNRLKWQSLIMDCWIAVL